MSRPIVCASGQKRLYLHIYQGKSTKWSDSRNIRCTPSVDQPRYKLTHTVTNGSAFNAQTHRKSDPKSATSSPWH